jgi:hypothetical protein
MSADFPVLTCVPYPCCSLRRETIIADVIMTWLEKYLRGRALAREGVVKTFKKLLHVLDNRMYISVTLAINNRGMGIKAYANINSAGKPLTATDVLKAYLVQNKCERKDAVKLIKW